ncbi:hypothetical protein QBC32DRAFT_171687, partial [Pseudoneurospora amorphoporcata]
MSSNSSPLVYLLGEQNVDDWEQGLEAELDCLGLTDYVFAEETPEEPNKETEPNKDPKVLYDLIQSCIARVTNEARTEVLNAYMSIKRANFDSMPSFLAQYTKLRKRIQDAKYEFTDDIEVGHLYNAVKDAYPIDARHWSRALEDKQITTGDLLAKLSNIGIAESRLTNL